MSCGDEDPVVGLDEELPFPPAEERSFMLRVAPASFGDPPHRLYQVLLAVNVAGGVAASFAMEPAEAREFARRLAEVARYVELAAAPAAGTA